MHGTRTQAYQNGPVTLGRVTDLPDGCDMSGPPPALAGVLGDVPGTLSHCHELVGRLEEVLSGPSPKCPPSPGGPECPAGLIAVARMTQDMAAVLVKRLSELLNRLGG